MFRSVARERTWHLVRHESARFYCYRLRKRLAPLKISPSGRLRQKG
jgi:hypothetical protein